MTEHRNSLANEESPYLLQHAGNPVDWYPWGDAAFERARSENKPLFISIGYAACHWCHVMERESFEDEDVAALLNEAFVCVKVDREERPDIDRVYMDVAMMMTGRGGWPLTIIAAPDGTPFFAATYIPKENRFGQPGLLELLPRIADLYRRSPEEIGRVTSQVRSALRNPTAPQSGEPGLELLALARDEMRSRFDERFAGFGEAPKFPSPHQLMFLLRWWHRTGDRASLTMATRTLDAMEQGGIHDQLDHGFHRYSTDERWHLPHFEKMLYDQALIAVASAETFLATGEAAYAATARETLDYVLRRLGAPEGGFFCSEDADSEGEEGRFYLWTVDEVRDALGEDAELLIRAHGLTEEGNAVDEAGGTSTGRNVLGAGESLEALASEANETIESVKSRLDRARSRLLKVRDRRARPPLDDKVLTDWNGLAVAAFAVCGRALGNDRLTDAGERAARFLLDAMLESGRLLHRWRNGRAGIQANLDDYAFLAWGLIELHQATQHPDWLEQALALTDVMLERFTDERGGFHFTPDDGEELVARPKEIFDGALPAGSSVAAMNLVRLARLAGRHEYEEAAYRTVGAVTGSVRLHPSGHTFLLCAADHLIGPSSEVAVAGDAGADDVKAFTELLSSRFLPRTTVLVKDALGKTPAPWAHDLEPQDGSAAATVCTDGTCGLPTTDPAEVLSQVTGKSDAAESR